MKTGQIAVSGLQPKDTGAHTAERRWKDPQKSAGNKALPYLWNCVLSSTVRSHMTSRSKGSLGDHPQSHTGAIASSVSQGHSFQDLGELPKSTAICTLGRGQRLLRYWWGGSDGSSVRTKAKPEVGFPGPTHNLCGSSDTRYGGV